MARKPKSNEARIESEKEVEVEVEDQTGVDSSTETEFNCPAPVRGIAAELVKLLDYPLDQLPCQLDEMTAREKQIYEILKSAVDRLQTIYALLLTYREEFADVRPYASGGTIS